jgi:5'-nucleotidase
MITLAGALCLQTTLIFAITTVWKISVHSAAAAATATLAWWLIGTPLPLLVGVPIIAWSRVRLQRHSVAQTVAGASLGITTVLTMMAVMFSRGEPLRSIIFMRQPLILVTNDDGISSRGLWAVVEAVLPLGEVLVVAPDRQWSGGGRSMPPHVTGRLQPATREVGGVQVSAFAVDASPALAVVHGVVELAPRRPSLVVSGINSGANLGIEVTASGTVGAALEGGAFGIPSLAVSLEMDPAYHLSDGETADYGAAMALTRQFAEMLLAHTFVNCDVDAFSVNVPSDATPHTPWRLARLSRFRYFVSIAPDRAKGEGRPSHRIIQDIPGVEQGSDIWTLKVDRMVSVTPLSLDLTTRMGFEILYRCLCGRDTVQLQEPLPLFLDSLVDAA